MWDADPGVEGCVGAEVELDGIVDLEDLVVWVGMLANANEFSIVCVLPRVNIGRTLFGPRRRNEGGEDGEQQGCN